MRVACRVACALVAAAAAPTLASAQSIEILPQRQLPGRTEWVWSGTSPDKVVVRLVRAHVRVVRAEGRRLELRASSPDAEGDGSPVSLLVSHDGQGLRMIDLYPPSVRYGPRECLPPDGEHGGFWTYHERLQVTLVVPHGVDVSVAVMDGAVVGR